MIETARLILRQLDLPDAAFILELLNSEGWLRFIGDRGVRTLDDARTYITNGPQAMYVQHGFGLYAVVLKSSGAPIGMCGLIRRDWLADVDIGFAFLPQFCTQGFGYEAAAATINYGKTVLKLPRIVAIATPDNIASAKLLNKLGLTCRKTIQQTPTSDVLCLFEP